MTLEQEYQAMNVQTPKHPTLWDLVAAITGSRSPYSVPGGAALMEALARELTNNPLPDGLDRLFDHERDSAAERGWLHKYVDGRFVPVWGLGVASQGIND